MTSRPELLIEESESYPVAWDEFLNLYKKQPDSFFCFFEGFDDTKYYGIRINSIVSNSHNSFRKNINCYGKKNVLEIFRLYSNRKKFDYAWVAFFIDRDFDSADELPKDERIYITPYYSIENFYVTDNAFETILRDCLGLSEKDKDFHSILKLYNNRIKEFNNTSEELNAWIYIHRKKGSKLCLRNVSFKQLYSVHLDKINKHYTIRWLNEKLNIEYEIPEKDIKAQIEKFRIADETVVFRGKYLLMFLRHFLVKLINECNTINKQTDFIEQKYKITLNLSESESILLSELSNYAETPECLKLFLNKRAMFRI